MLMTAFRVLNLFLPSVPLTYPRYNHDALTWGKNSLSNKEKDGSKPI